VQPTAYMNRDASPPQTTAGDPLQSLEGSGFSALA